MALGVKSSCLTLLHEMKACRFTCNALNCLSGEGDGVRQCSFFFSGFFIRSCCATWPQSSLLECRVLWVGGGSPPGPSGSYYSLQVQSCFHLYECRAEIYNSPVSHLPLPRKGVFSLVFRGSEFADFKSSLLEVQNYVFIVTRLWQNLSTHMYYSSKQSWISLSLSFFFLRLRPIISISASFF